MTDLEVRAMLDDAQTLTLTLLGEARGEEIEGRIAVANVIRNRMHDERWPDTIKDVCLQQMQFSCWQPVGGAANYKSLMQMAENMVNRKAMKSTFASEPVVNETRWVADGILVGVVRDRTGGANHYLTRQLWESAPPAWARGHSPTCLIQRHAFFKL